eukprot:6926599-Karenia_brevis.AAC.1
MCIRDSYSGSLLWESTLWEFTLSGHRFWIWKSAYNLEVYSGSLDSGNRPSRASNFGSGSPRTIWECTLGV